MADLEGLIFGRGLGGGGGGGVISEGFFRRFSFFEEGRGGSG